MSPWQHGERNPMMLSEGMEEFEPEQKLTRDKKKKKLCMT